MYMNTINMIATILVLVGALNWGLVGGFNLDLVQWVNDRFTKKSDTLARVIYILVGISAVFLIARMIMRQAEEKKILPGQTEKRAVGQAEGYGCSGCGSC